MNLIYTIAGMLILVFLYYCVLEAIKSRSKEDGEE
jgi:hypothetical protein